MKSLAVTNDWSVFQMFFNNCQNNFPLICTRHGSETVRTVVSMILLIAVFENSDSVSQSSVKWIPPDPITLQRSSLSSRFLQKFRIYWELIIFTVMIPQRRALTPLWSLISVEERDNKSIKHLCVFSVPISEGTVLTSWSEFLFQIWRYNSELNSWLLYLWWDLRIF